MFPSGDDISLEYMCGESRILVTWNVCNFCLHDCFSSLHFCRLLLTSVQQ